MAVPGRHTRSLQTLRESAKSRELNTKLPEAQDGERHAAESLQRAGETITDNPPERPQNVPVGEDIELGAAKFGGAGLRCQFIKSSSPWGKLGPQQAGVLHFNMIANQKDDIKIKWAEFHVIFRKYKNGTQSPAALLRYLEPRDLPGKEISVELKKRGLLHPKVKGGFAMAEGELEFGEKEKSTTRVNKYFWTLTTVGEGEGDLGRIERVVWEWQANRKAPQASSKILEGGAVVVSVDDGDFEIELRLRCRLKSRTQQFGDWIGKRIGFRKREIGPMIRKVHSDKRTDDLKSNADELWKDIWYFNARAQTIS